MSAIFVGGDRVNFISIPATGEQVYLDGNKWMCYDPCERIIQSGCTACYNVVTQYVEITSPNGREQWISNVELFLLENGYNDKLTHADRVAACAFVDVDESQMEEYLSAWLKLYNLQTTGV